MAALHRAGFANIATSTHPDDGLRLTDAYIVATVRCAPPDNKPLPEEIVACAQHLDAELAALARIQVVVTLGKIAWDAWFQHLARRGNQVRPRPSFGHGTIYSPDHRAHSAQPVIIGCYHPSRQNTNTGKVTPAMYDDVFRRVRAQLR